MENGKFEKYANDINQNVLTESIKEEISEANSYQDDLQSILNSTRQIQENDEYLLKTEVKEEVYSDEDMCQIDYALQKFTKHGNDQKLIDSVFAQSSDTSALPELWDDFLERKSSYELNTDGKSSAMMNPKKKILKKSLGTRSCSYCEYVASNKDELVTHRILEHTKSMNRKCKLCDFVTNSALKLKTHLNEHIIEEKHVVFKCQYCEYESMQCGHLKRHINSVHTKSSKHPCQFCDFLTTDFASMRKHIEEKHEKIVISGGVNSNNEPKIEYLANPFRKDEKEENSRKTRIAGNEKFQCQYCDYNTPFVDYLNIHINSRHTKNVLYKCKFCDYQATKLYTLRCHENSKHTKKVLYRCELCTLETTRSNILKRHIQRVHVEKSFKCECCEYISKKEGHVRNHMRKKHGKKMHKT